MTRHLRRTSAAVLAGLAALSLALTGCTAFTGTPTPPAPIRLSDSVISTPNVVDTPTGKYRTITVDPASAPYTYDPTKFALEDLTDSGFDEKIAAEGLHFVTKYVVEQYLDSAALEGDRKAFESWYRKDGALFVDQQMATSADQLAPVFVVLGNYAPKQKNIPDLVHDGKPRAKSATLTLVEAGPYAAAGKLSGLSYGLQFTADYRVSDKAAVAYLASRAGMSPEAFLKSGKVKPALRDEIGENDFRVKGRVNVVVRPGSNAWRIVGFENVGIGGDFV